MYKQTYEFAKEKLNEWLFLSIKNERFSFTDSLIFIALFVAVGIMKLYAFSLLRVFFR